MTGRMRSMPVGWDCGSAAFLLLYKCARRVRNPFKWPFAYLRANALGRCTHCIMYGLMYCLLHTAATQCGFWKREIFAAFSFTSSSSSRRASVARRSHARFVASQSLKSGITPATDHLQTACLAPRAFTASLLASAAAPDSAAIQRRAAR